MTAPAIPLVRGLHDFLNLFARGRGTLYIDARTDNGIGQQRLGLNFDGSMHSELHGALYPYLEDPTWGYRFTPVLDRAVMPVAFAVLDLAPDLLSDRTWRFDGKPLAALSAFPVRPTAVIDATPKEVAAFWALTEPAVADARAAELLRALAARLGQVPHDDPFAARAPFPGGIVRGIGGGITAVDFATLEPEWLVNIADLEAALVAPTRKGAKA